MEGKIVLLRPQTDEWARRRCFYGIEQAHLPPPACPLLLHSGCRDVQKTGMKGRQKQEDPKSTTQSSKPG